MCLISMYVISYSTVIIFYFIYGGRKGIFELTKFEVINLKFSYFFIFKILKFYFIN